MKFRTFILALVLSSAFTGVIAQDQESLPKAPPQQRGFWDKFYVGGNFGLQFGTYTVIDIEPIFGYRITERLSAGVGATYIYYHYKDPNYNYTFSSNIYGGSLFSKYLVFDNVFAQVEFQALNLEVIEPAANFAGYRIARAWIPAFYVGGGYRQPLGERAFLQLTLLYDIIQDRNSPFDNPVIRVGFMF